MTAESLLYATALVYALGASAIATGWLARYATIYVTAKLRGAKTVQIRIPKKSLWFLLWSVLSWPDFVAALLDGNVKIESRHRWW